MDKEVERGDGDDEGVRKGWEAEEESEKEDEWDEKTVRRERKIMRE